MNESVFEVIEPMKRIVIRHVSEPKYRLTIELAPTDKGTVVAWSQAFDDEEVAKRIAKIVEPANEQNLDRLTAEIERGRPA